MVLHYGRPSQLTQHLWKSTENLIVNDVLNMFVKIRKKQNRQNMFILTTFHSTSDGMTAQYSKERKKQRIKDCLFLYMVWVYIKKKFLWDTLLYHKLLQLRSEFSKTVGYKKPIYKIQLNFYDSNKQLEKEIYIIMSSKNHFGWKFQLYF